MARMPDLPLLDLPTLQGLTPTGPRCPQCERLGAAGWESLPQPDAAAHLHPVGTLRADPYAEPTLAEHHPAGTRYWSTDAPIAPAWFPYNYCEVWQCPHCRQAFLRYTEYGGYYQEARIRALQPALLVDPPAPAE